MNTIKCAFDGCESMATKKRRFCAHHVYSLRRKYYEEYENGTWTARLSHNKKHLTITFKTQEEAKAKRKEWEKLYP